MTGKQSDDEHRECGDTVAAYALGALETAEAEAFAAHLATCAVCHDELAAFRQVVDELALSPPRYVAPPGLRRQVLRAVPDEPRLERRAHVRRRRAALRLPRPALALGTGLAAAVIALAVVLGVNPGGGPTAPARVIHAQVKGPGQAQLRLVDGHAELVVHGFAAPPSGQIYEVWLKRATGSPKPAGALFDVNGRGYGNADVSGSLRGIKQVLVTAEPAGGTDRPTNTPVITAPLT